jgi:O-antigen ligase
MDKVIAGWGNCLFFSLCVSIILLGVGPLDFSLPGASLRAWSVSRTTFLIWLLWKLVIGVRYGRLHLGFREPLIPLPLWLFFAFVTISLLPDFHQAGDYRYFFLGAMHYLMTLDLCSDQKRWRLLFYLLALVPAVVALRGIAYDPQVLELDQMRRFGYPLPHPNIAGYLFAMTLPLCLAVAVGTGGKLRVGGALVSGGAQLLALVLTYSRGSWLGWGASLLSFGVLLRRWKEIGLILTVVGLLLFLVTPLQDRMLTLVRPHADFSINERMRAIGAGLKLGLEHPLLGVGYGRGRLREGLREQEKKGAPEIGHIAHTHSLYIELFAQTGLPGLGTFLWLLFQTLGRTLRAANRFEGSRRVWALGIASSWIAFAVTGLGDVPFYHHEVRILFFTLLALTHRVNVYPARP